MCLKTGDERAEHAGPVCHTGQVQVQGRSLKTTQVEGEGLSPGGSSARGLGTVTDHGPALCQLGDTAPAKLMGRRHANRRTALRS